MPLPLNLLSPEQGRDQYFGIVGSAIAAARRAKDAIEGGAPVPLDRAEELLDELRSARERINGLRQRDAIRTSIQELYTKYGVPGNPGDDHVAVITEMANLVGMIAAGLNAAGATRSHAPDGTVSRVNMTQQQKTAFVNAINNLLDTVTTI